MSFIFKIFSKVIFFGSIYHILSHVDPSKAQYLYSGINCIHPNKKICPPQSHSLHLDTDSFHIGLARESLDLCILPTQKESWDLLFLKYFDPAGISCVLLIEKEAAEAVYYAGKEALKRVNYLFNNPVTLPRNTKGGGK